MSSRSVFLLIPILLLLPLAVAAQNYIEPGVPPTIDPLAPPLNASDSVQAKSGNLLIGPVGGNESLCLNPEASNPSIDPALNLDCLNSWDNLSLPLGGPFVRLRQTDAGNDLDLVDYGPPDLGYARIRATDTSHAFSTVAYAPTNGNSVAVYGSDGGVSTNYAAYFAGRLALEPVVAATCTAADTTGCSLLCLNGTGPANCIASWDEVSGGSIVNYVKVQSQGTVPPAQLTPPQELQVGGASVTGVGEFAVAIAGNACAISNVATCGDGFCADAVACPVAVETLASCPIDCSVPGALTTFTAQPSGSDVTFTMTAGLEPVGSQVYYVVVRSITVAPSFVPRLGVVYTPGLQVGNSTVLASGFATEGLPIAIPPDTTLPPGSLTVHYHAYQGSIFPRYNHAIQPRQVVLDLVSLNFTKTGAINVVTASAPGWVCDVGCAAAYGRYIRGANIAIQLVRNSPGTWTWQGDCASTPPNSFRCDLAMTQDRTVNINIFGGAPPPPIEI